MNGNTALSAFNFNQIVPEFMTDVKKAFFCRTIFSEAEEIMRKEGIENDRVGVYAQVLSIIDLTAKIKDNKTNSGFCADDIFFVLLNNIQLILQTEDRNKEETAKRQVDIIDSLCNEWDTMQAFAVYLPELYRLLRRSDSEDYVCPFPLNDKKCNEDDKDQERKKRTRAVLENMAKTYYRSYEERLKYVGVSIPCSRKQSTYKLGDTFFRQYWFLPFLPKLFALDKTARKFYKGRHGKHSALTVEREQIEKELTPVQYREVHKAQNELEEAIRRAIEERLYGEYLVPTYPAKSTEKEKRTYSDGFRTSSKILLPICKIRKLAIALAVQFNLEEQRIIDLLQDLPKTIYLKRDIKVPKEISQESQKSFKVICDIFSFFADPESYFKGKITTSGSSKLEQLRKKGFKFAESEEEKRLFDNESLSAFLRQYFDYVDCEQAAAMILSPFPGEYMPMKCYPGFFEEIGENLKSTLKEYFWKMAEQFFVKNDEKKQEEKEYYKVTEKNMKRYIKEVMTIDEARNVLMSYVLADVKETKPVVKEHLKNTLPIQIETYCKAKYEEYYTAFYLADSEVGKGSEIIPDTDNKWKVCYHLMVERAASLIAQDSISELYRAWVNMNHVRDYTFNK